MLSTPTSIPQCNVWMETRSGRRPIIGAMQSDDVCIDDISVSLSRIVRYLGHTSESITVAEHSVLVSRIVSLRTGSQTLALAALLHDAKEAYMGDWPTPIKRALQQLPGFQDFKEHLENDIDQAICDHIGHGITPALMRDEEVRKADRDALAFEAFQLVHSKGEDWTFDGLPMPVPQEIAMDFDRLGEHDEWSANNLFIEELEVLTV